MKGFYRSGEIAKFCGCSADTIRHYERIGLIEKTVRSSNRYREYRKETVDRVKLIQSALAIGFTLKDLSGILRIRDNNGIPCKDVRDLAATKLHELCNKIEQLNTARAQLKQLIKEWDELLKEKTPNQRASLLDRLVGKRILSQQSAASNLKRRTK